MHHFHLVGAGVGYYMKVCAAISYFFQMHSEPLETAFEA